MAMETVQANLKVTKAPFTHAEKWARHPKISARCPQRSGTALLIFDRPNLSVLKFTKVFIPIAMFTVYQHSFCYSNVPTMKTEELFVSTANRTLVGTLISVGDVTRNIAIRARTVKRSGRLAPF